MSQWWRTTVLSVSLVVFLGGWGAMGVLSRRPDLNSILAARQLFTWMFPATFFAVCGLAVALAHRPKLAVFRALTVAIPVVAGLALLIESGWSLPPGGEPCRRRLRHDAGVGRHRPRRAPLCAPGDRVVLLRGQRSVRRSRVRGRDEALTGSAGEGDRRRRDAGLPRLAGALVLAECARPAASLG